MLDWFKSGLILLMVVILCLGSSNKDATWIWSLKKLKENWHKLLPLTKRKESWLNLWRVTRRFATIAIVIGIVIVSLWALLVFGAAFIPEIHITNNVLLMAMIFLWWITINFLRNSGSEVLLQEITELKDKIGVLELNLAEHMECKICESYPCECDD